MSGEDSVMGNIARYNAIPGDGCPYVVLDHGRRIHVVVAECGTKENAEMIARALNNSEGAVREIERL